MTVPEIASAQDLEKYIGYKFHDPEILRIARRSRSFLNENPIPGGESMEPLATFGDAILDAVAVYRLYEKGNQTEGDLSECKSDQVKGDRTQAFARKHNLNENVQRGTGEILQKHQEGNNALDTATEALIGAIFLDAQRNGKNGIIVVKDILERMNFFQSGK
jgi:ribonuclease III